MAIYGIYDFSNLGKLTLSFTIDSQSLLQTYQVTPTTPQFINEQGQEPNFKFYSYDFLTAGEHTLVVNVTECVNQTFRFDYLTYVPAFGKVSDMPTDLLTWASASGSGSGSTGGGGGGGKTSIGVIVGSVVGVLAGSVLLGVLLFFFLRRRKSATGEKGPERSDIQYFPCECSFIPPLSPPSEQSFKQWSRRSQCRTQMSALRILSRSTHDQVSSPLMKTRLNRLHLHGRQPLPTKAKVPMPM